MLETADLSCSILPRAADNSDANCSFSASCFLAYICVHVSHFARPSIRLALYPSPRFCPSLRFLAISLFLCICQSLASSSPLLPLSIFTLYPCTPKVSSAGPISTQMHKWAARTHLLEQDRILIAQLSVALECSVQPPFDTARCERLY